MAQLLLDALNGVTLDNQTVQSFLDAQLPSDVTSGSSIGSTPTTITLDEEDVFQCGKCKKQFTSFSLFMCHKKEHSAASPVKLPNLSLPLEGNLQAADTTQEPGSADSTSYQEIQVQPLDSNISPSDLSESIILSEADIFSFSIDQNDLSITSSTQAPSPLSSVIQPSGPFLASAAEPVVDEKTLDGSASPVTNSFNFATLSGQPIILTSELPQGDFMASTLPSIQSLNTQSKIDASLVISSSKKDNSQNINILATYPQKSVKECKLLLPSVDYFERNVENGTLLLECDDEKSGDKILHYRNGAVDSSGTVLLDFIENGSGKSCKVLLANGEYAETSIEYIESATDPEICEFTALPEDDDSEMPETSVAVNLLDVVHTSDGSQVTMDLVAEAVNEAVHGETISGPTTNLPVTIPETSTAAAADSLPVNSTISDECNSSGSQTLDSKDPMRLIGAKNLKLKCQYCEKLFSKNFDLQQHMRSHTGEKPFQCVVCGRAFSQKSNVKKHMATHKVWPNGLSRTLPKEPLQRVNSIAPKPKITVEIEEPEESEEDNSTVIIDRSYVCQYCTISFPSYFELKTHMKKHSHQKVYKCVQLKCQKTFEDLDTFLEHTNLHTDEVQYSCHVCFKKFNTLTDLGIHQYTHNPRNKAGIRVPRYFLCMKCKSKFTSSKALEHHLSTTNHNFPCTHCGKVFTCERYLRRHLPTHGAPESYICSTCGKGFRTEQYLNTHRLIHSGIKPYACMHCSAAFNRKDKLVRHSLIHQAVKKFKCPFHNYLGCSKEFNRQDKLKLHILTHSAVKPFHCRKCNRMFHKQSFLRDHERTHHSLDAPFACAQCGLRFRKKVHQTTHKCSYREAEEEPCAVTQAITERSVSGSEPSALIGPRSRRLKRVRNGKRTTATASRNPPGGSERCNGGSKDVLGDNVPTIEIIVMPMSLHERKNGQLEDKNVYHVMFPASSHCREIQAKLLKGNGGTHNFTINSREIEENDDQAVVDVML